MKVNDWSSVNCMDRHESSEKDQNFLAWLLECVKDENDLMYQIAFFTLQGLDVVAIAKEVDCAQRTVMRKQRMVAAVRIEYDADYWWA